MLPRIEDIEEVDCVICGSPLHRNWIWTDRHGEGICASCNAPYDMKGFRGVEKTQCLINEDWISICKEYWNGTKRGMGMGTYLGQTPALAEKIKAFNKWIEEKHPEKIKESDE